MMKTDGLIIRTLIRLLKISVVLGALYYLISRGKLDPRTLDLQIERLPWFVISVLGIALTSFISFYRWHILLKGVSASVPLSAIFRLGFIGLFFNTFMFGAFGGDVIKLAYIVRETHKRAEAAASVIIDRVCGLLGLLTLGGLAIIISWQEILSTPSLHLLALSLFAVLASVSMCLISAAVAISLGRSYSLLLSLFLLVIQCLSLTVWRHLPVEDLSIYAHGLTLGAILLSMVTAVFTPSLIPGGGLNRIVKNRLPMGERLMSFLEALLAFRHHTGTLFLAMLLSAGIQAIALFCLAGVAYSFGSTASISHVFFAAPPAFIANVLPVPMGGLGVGEACFNNLLELCRDSEGQSVIGGATVFLGLRIIQNLIGIIFGLPLYLRGKKDIEQSRKLFDEESKT